ncbi:helix-turn-helix domain-containing protein [Pseudomonas sp. S07E 245]|uniref:DnaT-like ssDNA-binding domain-containing protein n=1 Tax=Pseudomonas sp. S07E 245 TaxID=2866278 RepID=UPI001C730B73|nr:DnaT-like ssDNA-binding domain-containing protein [Pseudomonas sp. S07E 245]QYX55113.1 helix-turn-helix domain-containing protein [Pseudomonas sp. S07E 245]
MTWALAIPKASLENPAARHVLLCLANYAGSDGRGAFPSAGTLSLDTGLSERTVRLKLDELSVGGWIVEGNQAIAAAYIDRRDRRPVVYDLQLKRGASTAPRAEPGAGNRTGCSSQQSGVQENAERGAAAAPNTSINHSTHSLREPFEMFLEWAPDQQQLKAYAARAGLTLQQFTVDAISGFVLHHDAKGLARTEKQWLAALVNWVRTDLARAARSTATRSGAPQGSSFDDEDTTWLDERDSE